MYRQYEDPRELTKQLEELKAKRNELYLAAERETDPCKKDALFDEWADTAWEVDELKDRINFAWQDEEYDLAVAYTDYEVMEGVY